jgi:hypothetical protein
MRETVLRVPCVGLLPVQQRLVCRDEEALSLNKGRGLGVTAGGGGAGGAEHGAAGDRAPHNLTASAARGARRARQPRRGKTHHGSGGIGGKTTASTSKQPKGSLAPRPTLVSRFSFSHPTRASPSIPQQCGNAAPLTHCGSALAGGGAVCVHGVRGLPRRPGELAV